MAHFPAIQLTKTGKQMIGESQGNARLIFVRAELGDGQLSEGEDTESFTGLKHSVMSAPLQNFLDKGNGEVRLRFAVSNREVTNGFMNREIGIFAKLDDGEAKLYAYTNAGNFADYIPSKEVPIDSEIIDVHIIVAGAKNVTAVISDEAYVTRKTFEEHRTAAELDHPDGSVTERKLKDSAVTEKKIAKDAVNTSALKNGSVTTDKLASQSVTTVAIKDKAVTSDRIADNIALRGTPTAPTASAGTRSDQLATTNFVAAAITALVNSSPAALDTLQELAKAIGNDPNFATTILNKLSEKVSKSGDTMSGDLTANQFYTPGWFRARGNGGFYFEDHRGGWQMTDNEWVQSYLGKHVHTSGKMKADQGFEGRLIGNADNANRLGGQSLSDILNRINAQNTGGIVASSLAQNGWVKFANGLILQWGVIKEIALNESHLSTVFPISFSRDCFNVNLTISIKAALNGNVSPALIETTRAGFTFMGDSDGQNTTGNMHWISMGV